ncbi:hypothetical protein [Thermus scotoductus]|uniref:Uncharacterized protein n=1 Tax=Thermus scotoductus TaxID=37636 RepID=A0A430S2J4_THESC|nr:hypothetical protein [Thermus scotoductus]RTG98746.1 hypothetical protein CSW51_01235 [Thermus scotoductus]RTH27962.1 hypothetical protein CSW38_01995 [Thermus scotoductus]
MKNGKKAKEREQYRVFTTREYGEEQTFWVRIGTAFKGEKSIQVLLDALPLNGKLVILLENGEDEDDQEAELTLSKRRR